MSELIGKRELANMFAHAAKCIREEQERLSKLDSVGGDGDHGTTMLRAVEQLESAVDISSRESLTVLIRDAGWNVMGVDGGASSALLGTFFVGMADAGICVGSMDCHELARSFEAGLRAVSKQTKAQPGDKTMMDALTPAVVAFCAAASSGRSIAQAFEDASMAAQAGAESTKDLVARYGRAKLLGEKTRGYPDAGATSIALLFKGFSVSFANTKED